MNRILIIIFASCLMVMSVCAQNQQSEKRPKFDREAFIAKRNAYITAEVGLTPDEAAEFIPLCNELQRKMIDVELDYRKHLRLLSYDKDLSEEDCKKVLDEALEVHIKQVKLEKEYYERFKKILSYKKLYKYKVADEKFMREFIRNKHRRQNELKSDSSRPCRRQ